MNTTIHPTTTWRQSVAQPTMPTLARLRLAAIAGHMTRDVVVARRAALVDLLAEGRPLTRDVIWERVEAALGQPCWGKRPEETLLRDLNVLRDGGLRIAYSRQTLVQGYYLQYPAIEKEGRQMMEPPTPQFVLDKIRQQSADKKLAASFALADFALQQKRLLLKQQHSDWSTDEIDTEARRQVFGTRGLR